MDRTGSNPVGLSQAQRLEELARRHDATAAAWRNSPSGLSAMGFGRVTRGPVPANPALEAMAAEAKQRTGGA